MSQRLPPPRWALQRAVPGDRDRALAAHRRGALLTNGDPRAASFAERPIDGPPKRWARARSWRWSSWSWFWDPWGTFLAVMLANHKAFDFALAESGVELYFPVAEHTLTAAQLERLDALYEEREDLGGALGRRPTRWGELVEELREVRRAVEAGVAVTVEGRTLKGSGAFYDWAHRRYHALEDGYDRWIGDDER